MKGSLPSQQQGSSVLLTLASLSIIGATLYFCRPFLLPIFFSVFLSLIFSFPLLWLKKRGLGFGMSLAITIVLIFLFGFFFANLLKSSLNDLSLDLMSLKGQWHLYLKNFQTMLADKKFFLMGLDLSHSINIETLVQKLFSLTVFNIFTGFLKKSFLIFVFVAFMLLEIPSLSLKIKKILSFYDIAPETFTKFFESFRSYILIKFSCSLLTGFMIGLTLFFSHFTYCLLWGTLAFLLNFLPNIGSIIAALPTLLFSLMKYNWKTTLIVFFIYCSVNILVSSVIEPKWMGEKLGLSMLVIFLSFLLWGFLFGMIGFILAVPLTVMVKIGCECHRKTHWISILLSDKKGI